MPVSEPITALTPDLRQKLKERIENATLGVIKKNNITTYFRESPEFAEFRAAIEHLGDGDPFSQPDVLLQKYRETIQLSVYDSYRPWVARFFSDTCKESDVRDLLSPGLPFFIAASSATSGKAPKYFPKYQHSDPTSLDAVDKGVNPSTHAGPKNCIAYSLVSRQILDIVNDEGAAVKKVPVTMMSTGSIRMQNNLPVERDNILITQKGPAHTSPAAVSFIPKYRSFLLMHALFALADPTLEMMTTIFGTVFLDLVKYMEEEWDVLLDCIEKGELPDFEDVEPVKQYLVQHFPPNPERAAELRRIDIKNPSEGWLKKLVWPKLRVVVGIASGVFSRVIPKMRSYLGADVVLRSLGFTASETYIGTVYDDTNLNLFKVVSDDLIEFLDVNKEEISANLSQPWELETGKRYEIVVTTRDGLWRYRMGDVVELSGFDLVDGSPLIQYIERRNVTMRLGGSLTSERQLAEAIAACNDTLGQVVEFTVVYDDRTAPQRYGYLVETMEPLGSNAHNALQQVLDTLVAANPNIQHGIDSQFMSAPSIRILKPGSFREYRQWKIDYTKSGAGQMKVPVVIWDEKEKAFLSERVIAEV